VGEREPLSLDTLVPGRIHFPRDALAGLYPLAMTRAPAPTPLSDFVDSDVSKRAEPAAPFNPRKPDHTFFTRRYLILLYFVVVYNMSVSHYFLPGHWGRPLTSSRRLSDELFDLLSNPRARLPGGGDLLWCSVICGTLPPSPSLRFGFSAVSFVSLVPGNISPLFEPSTPAFSLYTDCLLAKVFSVDRALPSFRPFALPLLDLDTPCVLCCRDCPNSMVLTERYPPVTVLRPKRLSPHQTSDKYDPPFQMYLLSDLHLFQ